MSTSALINNWLYAALADADQEALHPQLVRCELSQGQTLLRSGQVVDVVHFPASCRVANVMTLQPGQTLAVSTVGREGVTGLAAFMANEPIGWDVIALVSGVAWSLPASQLRERARVSEDLQTVLLQATHQTQLEAHSQAICAAYHTILPRLARWLLTLQEHTGVSSFPITQQDLASLLGVQRTTIVEACNALTKGGALTAGTRGRIVVRDRAALKAAACSCNPRRPATRSDVELAN